MIYLGPWVWVPLGAQGGYWSAPPGAGCVLDLRAIPAMSTRAGAPQGFGVFQAPSLPAPYELLGANATAALNATRRTLLQSALSLATLPPARLDQALWNIMTLQSDPDGDARIKPALVSPRGELVLHLPGIPPLRQRVRQTDPEWARAQRVLRDVYRQAYDDVQAQRAPANLHRKLLTLLMRSIGATHAERRLLVPDDLPDDAPLPPETTLTETFDTADADALGPNHAWDEMVVSIIPFDGFAVVSNQVICDGASGVHWARANSDLSGVDHSAQLTLIALGTSNNTVEYGSACRFSASAQTAYSASAKQVDDTIRLLKTVAGTDTQLGTPVGITISAPDDVMVDVNGSTLRSLFNGAQCESITDTAIAGGTRCGIVGFNSFTDTTHVVGDNWMAFDAVVAPSLAPFDIQRAYRPLLVR